MSAVVFALLRRLSVWVLVCYLSTHAHAQGASGDLAFVDLDTISVRDNLGVYMAYRGGSITEITFPLDLSRLDPERGHDIARLGKTDHLVVMFDRYSVRAAASADCPGGYETFLRAFSQGQRRQVFARLIGDCSDTGRQTFNEMATWIEPDRFRLETEEVAIFRIVGDRVIEETGKAR